MAIGQCFDAVGFGIVHLPHLWEVRRGCLDKKNIRDYRKQIELYKNQREVERTTREEIARIRYDLKQELVYLSHLLQCQEYEKMKEVLDSLYGELQ